MKLIELLSRGLVVELVEALASKRSSCSAGVQRHAHELLQKFLVQKNVDLGGARSVDRISPVSIRRSQLLRDVIARGDWQAEIAAMVWCEANAPLLQAAKRLASESGVSVGDFSYNHIHPAKWDPALLDRLANRLSLETSYRIEQAALALFVASENVEAASSHHESLPQTPPPISAPIAREPVALDEKQEHAGNTITATQRSNLRDAMRNFSEQLGMGPLRESAKEAGLLGREAKTLDSAGLKKRIADADQLTKFVVEALEDRSREGSALRTLQRISRRAQIDPSLDSRAQTHFQRATRALEQQQWESFNRALACLIGLRDETPHRALDSAHLIVLLSSAVRTRVLYALNNPGTVFSTPPTIAYSTPHVHHASDSKSSLTLDTLRAAIASAHQETQTQIGSLPQAPDRSAALSQINKTAFELQTAYTDASLPTIELVQKLDTAISSLSNERINLAAQSSDFDSKTNQKLPLIGAQLGVTLTTPTTDDIAALRSDLLARTRNLAGLCNDLIANLEKVGAETLREILPAEAATQRPLVDFYKLLKTATERAAEVEARRNAEPISPPTASDFLAFKSATTTPPSPTGLAGKLLADRSARLIDPPYAFLPLENNEEVLAAKPGATAVEQVNVATGNLLRLWAGEIMRPERRTGQLLEFLSDARALRSTVNDAPTLGVFDNVLVAFALASICEDRSRAKGQRRAKSLISCTSADAVRTLAEETAQASSTSPALARVACELLTAGLGVNLAGIATEVAIRAPADGRRLLDALAIAIVLGDGKAATSCRNAVLRALGTTEQDLTAIDDYLHDVLNSSRRGTRPDVPQLSGNPLATDFTSSVAARTWELGRGSGQAKVSVSIPRAALKGIFVETNSRNIEVPILVRNGGDRAAAGISLSLGRPVKGDSPIVGTTVEVNIPWLSDSGLEETASMVIARTVELDADKLDSYRELRLSVKTSWLGGRADETYVIPLQFTSTQSLQFEPLDGYDGRPLNLNNEKTLNISSASVLKGFTTIRDTLARSTPLRACIFGKRRRGKSSICTSLRDNPELQRIYAIQDRVWNGPRMTSVETAFATLSEVILAALSKTGESRARLDLSDLSKADEVSERFLHWFDSIADSLTEKKRVLIILDEFQKWLTGLASAQERVALLGALRHFNDRKSNLEVSLVLSGLQNLRSLLSESRDLANALERFEIRALTNEEADRYIREHIPVDLDGRARRRLVTLSGGNPYVLNRLGGNLMESLAGKRRRWCTVTDVDALLVDEDAQTGRLNEFMKYMLHEDEDDGAASLKQLTVLRATASILAERGDYDGYVRVAEAEAWLTRNRVEFDPGIVAQQLEELMQLDLLQSKPGGRYYLRGEWLCRSLAALDVEIVKLQSVTDRGDPDLVLRRYRRKALIDHGGEAEVWLAQNVEGGPDVVLRLYPQALVGLHDRIEREKAILERIRHPNVVEFRGAAIDDRNGGVIVLEHIQGSTVDSLWREDVAAAATIKPGGELINRFELLRKLASAVAACHAAGVVHKDLSPRNVMLEQKLGVWEPKLIDFGIAGIQTQPIREGVTAVFGTPGYIAPEKIKNPSQARTTAADIYSLGALFVKILTDKDPSDVADSGPALELLFTKESIPHRAYELIQRMLAPTADARPSADEVIQGLDAALEPLSWRELHIHAVTAFMEDRLLDAERLFGQALAAVSQPDRAGVDYEKLLDEALDMFGGSERITWDTHWVGHWLQLGRTRATLYPDGSRVLGKILQYKQASKQAGAHLIKDLVTRIAESTTSQSVVPFLAQLARQEELRDPAVVEQMFDALALYCSEAAIDTTIVEDFCVAAARTSRIKYQQLVSAELWLQRARRIGGGTRSDYALEEKTLLDAKKRTGKLQTLPPTATSQEPFRIGEKERGHVNVDRIERFDVNVRRRFPFIVRLERVQKDSRIQISKPTLLRMDSLSRQLPQGAEDPGNIIPLALDPSFTGDVPLRVNIVLSSGISSAQRDAARAVMCRDADLFSFEE